MNARLSYQPLERLPLRRPVDRIAFIVERCRGRRVLDLGCYDETALAKRDSRDWLHGEIARVAERVLGVDSSSSIPAGGIETGPASRIVRGDVAALDRGLLGNEPFEVVVAGELIEHVADASAFLARMRALAPGAELLCSTPNATSLTNVLLACLARESNHPDHVQVFSYKTLNTLCLRAGFEAWDILTYHVYYTEMLLRSGGLKRAVVRAVEKGVNLAEWTFPLLAGGLLLHVRRI